MFQKLTPNEAEERGIRFSVKVDSETGELRARLTAGGKDMTLTETPRDGGGWQRSHWHKRVVEMTMVVSGQVVSVEKTPAGAIFFRKYEQGDMFQTRVERSHNVFVPGGTVLATVKLNDDPNVRDWVADPELDNEVTHLNEEQAFARCTN